MAIRTSMAALVTFVSELVSDEDTERFTQDQVQAALDAVRVEHRYTKLEQLETRTAGTVSYLTYQAPTYLETDVSIVNANYSAVSPTTSDYTAGRFTFSSEPSWPLYVTGYEHDPYGAAADLLERYAASEADRLQSFSGANGSFAYAGKAAGIRKAATDYRARSKRASGLGMRTIQMVRGDMPKWR